MLKHWMLRWWHGLRVIGILMVGLASGMLFMWLLIFPLRALGDMLFVPYSTASFEHLTRNALLNQFYFYLPLLFLCMGVVSYPLSYQDEWRKLPRRDKILRRSRLRQLNLKYTRNIGRLIGFVFLISIPGLRDYTIVTRDGQLIEQDWYAAQVTLYPLVQLRCIEQSVIGRGAIFQTLHFNDGSSVTRSGLNPVAIRLIQQGAGLSQPRVKGCH